MDRTAENILKEHLPYELDMLELTYDFVHSPQFIEQRRTDFLRYSAIESFWTHARNLNEFFVRLGHKTAQGVAAARDFTDKDFNFEMNLGGLDDKMNVQISHLQYERPSAGPPEKLGGYDMQRVRQTIDRAVKEFESHLTPEARTLWEPRGAGNYAYIVSGDASACTTITTSYSMRLSDESHTSLIQGWTGPVKWPEKQ